MSDKHNYIRMVQGSEQRMEKERAKRFGVWEEGTNDTLLISTEKGH